MDGRKALLTGITGFVGRHLADHLERKGFAVTALVRPGSDPSRISQHGGKLLSTFMEADLSDSRSLRDQLRKGSWDVIFHVGAIRGGRHVSREEYYGVNVQATVEIARYAREKSIKLIYCSSVGVYGAIPCILPAPVDAPLQEDNYYHYTKIEAERGLRELMQTGLDCTILRPSITYGPDDYGFPFTLVSLVERGFFFLPSNPVKIHLADVDMLCETFIAASTRSGGVHNVADLEPVELGALVNFIHLQLKGTTYPSLKRLPSAAFRLGESVTALLGNELWKARFQLISRSWYYDVATVKSELGVDQPSTIPTFGKVISWYRSLQG